MHCSEFIDRYTDYRDGLVTAPRDARRFARHLAACAACRAYDATLRDAVRALQGTDPVTPSADFRRRLDARLARERVRLATPDVPRVVAIAAGLFIAVGLTLLGAHIVRRPQPAVARALPPVPYPQAVAQAGVPFVTFQDPRAGVVAATWVPYGAGARAH